MHDIERQGPGRRNGDSHCDRHEENSNDIAKMKASLSLFRWVVTLGIPFLFTFSGVLVSPYLTAISKIETSVSAIQTAVNNGATSDAVTRSEMQTLQSEITNIKEELSEYKRYKR